ncbi:MAG TPA: N-acetylmuramoyl-L-alanine amidase, partial [Chthonomonadales bacterium]|nr:N-acetylmuramoyl-L-alanine amidase [Chthonomonadales bacterium]
TTYYHKNDPSSRALAQSIVERIGQVSGLPVRGAKSDGVLYTNGLAVLRNSTVPAVLIEVGYINNVKDRQKLLNAEFQQRVARAIVAGIRGYVEGVLPEDPLVEVNEN